MASPAELPPWLSQNISVEWAVKLILYYLFGATPPTPGAGIPVTPGTGEARTLTSTTAAASGSVSAGAKSVSFVTSSDWSGSVNGATRGASLAFSVSVINPGDTLPAIAYVRSAGTLYIDVMT